MQTQEFTPTDLPGPTDELTIKIKIRAGNKEERAEQLKRKLVEVLSSLEEGTFSGDIDNEEGFCTFVTNPILTPEMKERKLYLDACRLVAETQQASVSLFQRRLRIGYAMAARFIDAMERDGYIGTYSGAQPRKVFLKPKPKYRY